MKPTIKSSRDKALQVMENCGLDQSYSIEKTVMETGLYSVYLLSPNNRPNALEEVLLIEHLPAQEPSAHFLSLKTSKPLTTSELMEEIVGAVDAHFSKKEQHFF